MSAGSILRLGYGGGTAGKVLTFGYGRGEEVVPAPIIQAGGARWVPPEIMLDVRHVEVAVTGGGHVVVFARKANEQPSPQEQLFAFLVMSS